MNSQSASNGMLQVGVNEARSRMNNLLRGSRHNTISTRASTSRNSLLLGPVRQFHPHGARPSVAPTDPPSDESLSHESFDEEAELEAARYFEQHPELLNESIELQETEVSNESVDEPIEAESKSEPTPEPNESSSQESESKADDQDQDEKSPDSEAGTPVAPPDEDSVPDNAPAAQASSDVRRRLFLPLESQRPRLVIVLLRSRIQWQQRRHVSRHLRMVISLSLKLPRERKAKQFDLELRVSKMMTGRFLGRQHLGL